MVEENNEAPKGEGKNTADEVENEITLSADNVAVQDANKNEIKLTIKGREITLNSEEVARKLKMSADQVVNWAKDNPNTFVATIISGPIGFLIGRQLDLREKETS